MSDHKDTKLEIIKLFPKEIHTDPRYDVRPFERHATGECQLHTLEELELLAQDIEANGQIDPVLITPEHILICGHRRLRAITIINDRHSLICRPLLKINCNIDGSGDLFLKAIASNLQRKNLSPIDLAYVIHAFRTERNYLGDKGVAITAKLLHISRYTIYDGMKLMQSNKEIQNRLHEGAISTQSALMVMQAGVPPDDLIQIFRRGREIQQEDQTMQALVDVSAKRKSPQRATEALARVSGEKRIKHHAVVKSLQEYREAKHISLAKPIPLSYSDFLKGLTALDAPGLCAEGRSLIRYLVKEYATGKGSQEELRRQFQIAFDGPAVAPAEFRPAACS